MKNPSLILVKATLLFVCSFALAVFYFSFGKSKTQNRNIASIELDFDGDFSYLSGEAFKKEVSGRIVRESYIEDLGDGKSRVNISTFKLTSNGNNHTGSCDVYSEVWVQFYAEGVSISGEVPNLLAEAKCLIEINEDYIQTMVIPSDEIKDLSPNEVYNSSITFQDSRFIFSDLGDFWPETWVAYELVFVSSMEGVSDLVIKIDTLQPDANHWILNL